MLTHPPLAIIQLHTFCRKALPVVCYLSYEVLRRLNFPNLQAELGTTGIYYYFQVMRHSLTNIYYYTLSLKSLQESLKTKHDMQDFCIVTFSGKANGSKRIRMFKTIHIIMLQLQNIRETNKKPVFLTMLEITQLQENT